ncbi:putative Zn-dependent protease [Murinocardiopsis flavida]|uniref:Putative Zn-dependent protease n=1 Tax=Murinocardiopsis flavida TaxID=645275 RepID=A0A2P8DSJ7_9ACTN|nr:metallopeptidase TldD-related protein [Murinocardiopsis flavida]PSL00194.1 putative Zn-dependent protease [Murinocardiopsis flavida]
MTGGNPGRNTVPAAAGRSTPQAVVERALALSRGDGCMVLVSEHSTANLRWAGNSLTTNGVADGRSVTVVALAGGRAADGADGVSVGVVSRSGLRDDELEDLVRAAEAAARSAAPSEEAAPLLEPGDPAAAGSAAPWDAPAATTAISVFGTFAPALGQMFERYAKSGAALYGYAEHSVVSTFFGSSTGLRLRHDQPTGTVDLNAKSAANGGAAHSTWVGQSTRDFTDVDAAALDARLARRLEWGRRSVELPAGRYETLLPPSAVADLMADLYWSAGARDAVEGRTAFAAEGGTRVGERVSALPLTLRSDPREPGLECDPFVLAGAPGRRASAFDNGLALQRTEWISDGVLGALPQSRRSARLTGLPVAPDIDNLVLEQRGADATVADMIAGTERGLLLNCLWYMRTVDPKTMLLTGITRDGVYLVEDGEVTAAVNNFRFNESPLGLLQRATEAGAAVPTLGREFGDYFTRTSMAPLRVPDFNMSTVSKAS